MTEKIIKNILTSMQDSLSQDLLKKLENTLVIHLSNLNISERCTEHKDGEKQWEKVLRLYIASKRLENCSDETLENYNRCIRMMMEELNKNIDEITTNDLRFYLASYQEKRKISLSYMETLRHYISSFFKWTTDEGYTEKDPSRRLKRVKVPQKIKQVYTAEEREHLKYMAKTQRDLALMELLYSTDGRIGEIVSLNRSDVDFINKQVVIYGQKGKKERVVYLTDECIYHLKKYLNERKDDNPALFVTLRKPHKRLNKCAIQAMLKKLGKEANIHVHPHKFRRTMLTDAGLRGMPLQEIQAYAGHTKPDTTMLYLSIKDDSIKSTFKKLIA